MADSEGKGDRAGAIRGRPEGAKSDLRRGPARIGQDMSEQKRAVFRVRVGLTKANPNTENGAFWLGQVLTNPPAKVAPSWGPRVKTDQKCRPPGVKRGDIKEGCAERIARFGTLSQNGYGECLGRYAGTVRS